MKKILIVDDQLEVRDLVDVTLRTDDYKILQAKSGEDAIEIAKKENPDLVIMDVMIPGGMDGLNAMGATRKIDGLNTCPILMLTAKGQDADMQKGMDTGAADYFVKPFSPLDLIKKIDDILGR